MDTELTTKSFELEKQILEFIEQVRKFYSPLIPHKGSEQDADSELALRFLALAKTDLEKSFLALRHSLIHFQVLSDNKEPATSPDKEEREINIRWDVLRKKENNYRFCWSYLGEKEVYCTDIEAISLATASKKFKDIMERNCHEKDIFVISYDVLTR